MVKVDLILPGFMTAPNGLSHFVSRMNESKELFRQNGIDLRVISFDLFSKPSSTAMNNKMKTKTKIFMSLAKYSALLTRFALYWSGDRIDKKILEYYETIPDKGDVIAFQGVGTAHAFLKRNKITNQKILLTIHSNGEMWSQLYFLLPKFKSRIFDYYRKDYEKTLFDGCDKIGFVSDNSRKHFCEVYGFDEKRTYFAYTSIERKEDPFPFVVGEKVKFICSGSLGERKNQMGILEAIELLPEAYQDKLSLTVLSDGVARKSLEAKAKTLKADISFTGNVDSVEEYLSKANCYILYSKDEGQPMSITEAMREGLPIIGSNVAGIPEQIVEGKTGFIVSLDPHDLADTLKYIIDNKELLPSMGQASYQYFLDNFTIDAMIKKYSEIYKS